MAQFYFSASEFINKHQFDVWVPAFYHPNMAEQMPTPPRPPVQRPGMGKRTVFNQRPDTHLRHLEDPDRLQRASYTVGVMLDMFRKKIEFQIARDEDVVTIFEGLDRYLLSLKKEVEMNVEAAVDFARLTLRFREQTYKHYYRYMMNNPAAREALYPNNDTKGGLSNLLAALHVTGSDGLEFDPLRAKAKPPYVIDEIVPKPVEESQVEILTSSYGIPNQGAVVHDDGAGFDFNKFTGRS